MTVLDEVKVGQSITLHNMVAARADLALAGSARALEKAGYWLEFAIDEIALAQLPIKVTVRKEGVTVMETVDTFGALPNDHLLATIALLTGK